MKRRELVERYLDAWNRRDVGAVLELFNPGAAVYDALWRESCVGSFVPKYLQEGLEEDEYWYEITNDLIYFDEGVVYNYTAFEWDGSQVGEKRFEGVEVMTVLDNKIVTLSNYYSDPDPRVLLEVAKLSASRHGIPKYVSDEYSGYKQVHIKHRLFHIMADDSIPLDRTLTVAGLAEKIGCNVDHLLRLVEGEFGKETGDFVGREHVRCAVELLDS